LLRRRRVGVRPTRAGFALVWVIVTVAIVAALIAAAAPTLAVMNERERAERTAFQLKLITIGVWAFRERLNVYPGNLSQLTNAVTTASRNSCRGTFTSGQVNDWADDATFSLFYMPTNGLWTELGRIRDSIPVRTANAAIYVEIPGVRSADAAMLNLLVDGGSGDTVTFAAPVNDTTTIRYRLLSSGQIDDLDEEGC
jgi:type II secretory pathway pseudopilin PulG